jgi:hypothetical protein
MLSQFRLSTELIYHAPFHDQGSQNSFIRIGTATRDTLLFFSLMRKTQGRAGVKLKTMLAVDHSSLGG